MGAANEPLWNELIWKDKDRMSGAPCIQGTRIRVQDLFDWLASGESVESFLETYPHVERDKVVGILRLAEAGLLKDISAA